MENNIQQQILEELEIRSLYFKLNEKALQRSLKIWNKHYQNNLSKPLGTIILLKKIRVKNNFLFEICFLSFSIRKGKTDFEKLKIESFFFEL